MYTDYNKLNVSSISREDFTFSFTFMWSDWEKNKTIKSSSKIYGNIVLVFSFDSRVLLILGSRTRAHYIQIQMFFFAVVDV